MCVLLCGGEGNRNAMGNECTTAIIRRQRAPANVLLHGLVAKDVGFLAINAAGGGRGGGGGGEERVGWQCSSTLKRAKNNKRKQ